MEAEVCTFHRWYIPSTTNRPPSRDPVFWWLRGRGTRECRKWTSPSRLSRLTPSIDRNPSILYSRSYPVIHFMAWGYMGDRLLSVNDVAGMQRLQSKEYLRCIKFGLFFWEFILEGEQPEEFTPGAILEYEVEFILILEALLELDEEGMLQFTQNILFSHDILLLILLDYVLLLEHLQSIELVVLQLPHQQHLRIGSLSDHWQNWEVF